MVWKGASSDILVSARHHCKLSYDTRSRSSASLGQLVIAGFSAASGYSLRWDTSAVCLIDCVYPLCRVRLRSGFARAVFLWTCQCCKPQAVLFLKSERLTVRTII